MYDSEARGSRLLDRSRLSPQDQRLVLVGARYSLTFEDVSESLVMQFPDFKPAPPVMGKDGQLISRAKGSGKYGGQTTQQQPTSQGHQGSKGNGKFGPKKVFLAESGEPVEQSEQQELEEPDGEDGAETPGADQAEYDQTAELENGDQDDDLDDLVQVLTVTARRLASVKLGRKYTGNKASPSELKKKTACAICGEVGHWKGDPECKVSGKGASASTSSPSSGPSAKKGGKGDKPHQTFTVMHSDLGNYEVRTGYGTAFGDPDQVAYQVNVVFSTQEVTHNSGFVGYMVLDTACQRTCCGRRWLQEHRDLLAIYDLDTAKVDCRDKFQFGKGEPITADLRAYIPAVLDDGSAFYFGTGVLDAGVPLLASNPLLKALGMVLDLPRMVVYFELLSAEVPVVNLKGHLAINIAAFSASTTAHLKRQMGLTDWQNAAPELPLEQPSSYESIGHASAAATMVAEMALPDADLVPLQKEPVSSNVSCSAPGDLGPSLADPGDTATPGQLVRDQPPGLQPRRHLQVRQCNRTLRQVPEVQDKMGVERRRPKVATAPLQRIFALIGTAVALLGQYSAGTSAQQDDFASGGVGQDETYLSAALPQYDLSHLEGETFHTDELSRGGGGGGAPGRMETPGRRWPGDGGVRLGRMKGIKRLTGNISRASRILGGEVKVYQSLPSVASRPPGCVDLLELFAGEARPSAAAAEHGLHACQPVDLIHGWDLDTPRDQDAVRAMVRRLRPWLLLVGYPCTYYNSFNENMNHARRPHELQARRELDRPRREFLVELCKEQAEHGRHFLIENPQRSRLWEQEELLNLANLPGTTMGHAHLGAFGMETSDGQPVVKPIGVLTNMPGLAERLSVQLSATDRQYCTPIRGTEKKRSQVYPHAFVHEILVHLRELVAEKEPLRFGKFKVFAVARPVSDIKAWDDVFTQLTRDFAAPNRRSFDIDLNSQLGKDIQDLFRIKAVKIQAAPSPIQRRFLMNQPYSARGVALEYIDGSRHIEVEQLEDVRHPKGRFNQAVRYAVFIYGDSYQEPTAVHEGDVHDPSVPVPGLPTDVTFPTLGQQVPPEIRRSVARLHTNLGHPSPQELSRLLLHRGIPNAAVLECVKKLHCATCERLKGPQQPRPASSTVPSTASQFNELVQGDFFYVRLATGQAIQVLGLADTATGFHQAAVLRTKGAKETYDLLDRIWLRPYGLPARLLLDPDPLFQGDFDDMLSTVNVQVDFCPAEAHWVIGMVERRNAVLRTILERLISDHSASTVDDLEYLISPAIHSMNSFITNKGRSPFQAVFGRVPQMPGGLFTDQGALAESPLDPGLNATLIRSEAIQYLSAMNADKGLRRALLRKTRNTKVPDLQPGQRCSFWRWRKRGLRKRGAWTTGRFLSWDPEQPGKQAWVRSGNSTILVATEQLREAIGFESWAPDERDVQALKDAMIDLKESVWQDERGLAPETADVEDDYDLQDYEPSMPATPSMAPIDTVVPLREQLQARPSLPAQQRGQTTNYNLNMSPTYHQTIMHQQRFGDPDSALNKARTTPRGPRASRTPRGRSRTPSRLTPTSELPAGDGREQPQQPLELPDGAAVETSAQYGSAAYDSAIFDDPVVEANETAQGNTVEAERPAHFPQQEVFPELQAPPPTAAQESEIPQGQQSVTAPFPEQETQAELQAPTPGPASASVHSPTEEISSSEAATQPSLSTAPLAPSEPPLPQLPLKRPFDALTTLLYDDGELVKVKPDDDYHIGVFGPKTNVFYQAYLSSQHRKDDVPPDKMPDESDTTDTDHGGPSPGATSAKRQLSRKELKQLDREIPWTQILRTSHVPEYLKAIDKESTSWMEWKSVEPLSHDQAKQVLNDKILCKRILRTRACCRDKARGQGPLRAKCRIVCLGHRDPDLFSLNRQAPTPNRSSEHVIYYMIVAGANGEVEGSPLKWQAWTGDASTAFLQGQHKERTLPLFLKPPADGLINQTPHWKAPLYKVCSNIYGLADAPRVWALEVISRLLRLGYTQHSFDKMIFLKRCSKGKIISAILVYVDDFLGTFRSDYNFEEVKQAFQWGSLEFLEIGKPIVFKGKEVELFAKPGHSGRFQLRLTQKAFLDGLAQGKLPRGCDLEEKLDKEHKEEFRSVAGSLQWLSSQTRPELSPFISLSNKGEMTSYGDLKSLYLALGYAKQTANEGLVLADVPLGASTTLVSYADSSFANTPQLRSQYGVLILASVPQVSQVPCLGLLLDWRSGKSSRVCRSTLAAEAMAADEAVDRSAYLNLFISEILTGCPAHRVQPVLRHLHVTDAKSLYDVLESETPNLTDKRSLVNIRAVQEVVKGENVHWVPTHLMKADGLTKMSLQLMEGLHSWLLKPFIILRDIIAK